MAYIQLKRQKALLALPLITVLSASSCSEQKNRDPSADAPVECENNRDRVHILTTIHRDISITLNPDGPLGYFPTGIIDKSKFVPNCSGPILSEEAYVGVFGIPKPLPVQDGERAFAVTRIHLSVSYIIPDDGDDGDEWPLDAFSYKKELNKDARLELGPHGIRYTAINYTEPNGEPLVMSCSKGPKTERFPPRCNVGYKISPRVTLRYRFNKHDYKPNEYLELDNAVRKILIEEVILDLSQLR